MLFCLLFHTKIVFGLDWEVPAGVIFLGSNLKLQIQFGSLEGTSIITPVSAQEDQSLEFHN
jgi:hypothetical protein